MKKRIFSLLLAAFMLLSMLPAQASAEETLLRTVTGYAGPNATFQMDITSIVNSYGNNNAYLTISGKGAINTWFYDVQDRNNAVVRTIDIKSGITEIGADAFAMLTNCRNLHLPSTLEVIGRCAFAECFMSAPVILHIPAKVRSIADGAFYANNVSRVYIDSPTVAANIIDKESMGNVITYADQILIKTNITTIGSYIEKNFLPLTNTETYNGSTYKVYMPYTPQDPCDHRYTDKLYYNATEHWYTCLDCGKHLHEESHFFSLGCGESPCECGFFRGGHEYADTLTCIDIYSHGYRCKHCHLMKAYIPHVFDNDCDTTCDDCGYVRQITHDYKENWTSTDTEHWYECRVCGDKAKHAEHVYDDACDTFCDICSHIRTVPHDYREIWISNNESHWYECDLCGQHLQEQTHTLGEDGKTCDICKFDITMGSFDSGTGSQDNPYIIRDYAQMRFFLKSVAAGKTYYNQYIRLAGDISLNDETFTFLPDTGLVKVTDGTNTAYLGTGIPGTAGYNTVFDTTASTPGAWYADPSSTAAGTYAGELLTWDTVNGFNGYFDGGCFTVNGLYINNNKDYQGFLGSARELSNLNIKNSYVKGGYDVGGAVGYANKVTDCFSNAIVCGDMHVGGVAGRASSNLESCNSTATVSGNSYVGGVAGQCGDMTDCLGQSIVYARDDYAGGIAGQAYNLIDCGNNGTVSGGGDVGGITGNVGYYSTVQNCYNTGIITSTTGTAAGIAAVVNSSSSFTGCYNEGAITGEYAYGICGAVSNGDITHCRNTGAIAAVTTGAGIAGGISNGTLSQCYNLGNVTQKGTDSTYYYACAAGIVSGVSSATVQDCYNTGNITGTQAAAGIATDTNYGTKIQTCYSTGTIRNTTNRVAAGGIMDAGSSSYVVNCYYLANSVTNCYGISGSQKAGYGIGNAQQDTAGSTTALTKSNMNYSSYYTGFDFYAIWSSWEGRSTPELRNTAEHTIHSYNYWVTNGNQHWYECKTCGLKTNVANHDFSTDCDATCNTCGYERTVKHSYLETWSGDGTQHWHACTGCTDKKDVSDHLYTDECDASCNICGYVRQSPPHLYEVQNKPDNTGHWDVCKLCGATTNEQDHVWGYACDLQCDVCYYKRDNPHLLSDYWSSNENAHYHKCLYCRDPFDSEVHQYDNACDGDCNVCGYTRFIFLGHTYTDECDSTCNQCGNERTPPHKFETKWTKSSQGHWYKCALCSTAKEIIPHTYDNSCDTDCNECGYKRTITHSYSTQWSTDETNHWYECTVCGEKKDSAAHRYTNVCDPECNVCGYTRDADHVFSTSWSKDYGYHWHNCTGCTEYIDRAAHEYSSSCDVDCDICNYKRSSSQLTHSYESAWTYDETQHWHKCTNCDTATKDAADHYYSDACDTTCNGCGYVREVGDHVYEDKWNYFSNDYGLGTLKHFRRCTICNHYDQQEHVFNGQCGETCEVCGVYRRDMVHTYESVMFSKDFHDQTCTVCGKTNTARHTYDDNCDEVCNDCGYTRDDAHYYYSSRKYDETQHWYECNACHTHLKVEAHIFEDNCDMGCSLCAYRRTPPHNYKVTAQTETQHTLTCSSCRSTTTKAHDYDNDCDTTCNTCSWERTVPHSYGDTWVTDGENHWKVCTLCGAKAGEEAHSFQHGCDPDCDVCGHTRQTEHDFSGDWVSDADNHWHSCSKCPEIQDKAAHTWEGENCSICGRSKVLRGDLNDDKLVTDADAIYLLRHTLFPNVYLVNQSPDMNGDGIVNDTDAIYLLRHTLFPNVYPLR